MELMMFTAAEQAIIDLQARVGVLEQTVEALTKPKLQVGFNWHAVWSDQDNPATRSAILDNLKPAFGWVRIDIAWASCQPVKAGAWDEGFMAKLDGRIADAKARGLKVLLMTYWPPAWSGGGKKNGQPANPADYGNFLAELAVRCQGRVEHFEMWNEPDLDAFWHSRSPQEFARLIKAAYPIAKKAAPWATFILGAPTYLGLATKWHQQLYDAGVLGCYDALALHPYMSPSDLGPRSDTPSMRKWSIAGIADVQKLQAANGDTAPIWVTEFGWSTHTSDATVPNHKRGVSEVSQATYTVDALTMFVELGVTHAFAYTDRDTTHADVHENSFGLLRRDCTPKPVVGSLAAR